MKICIFGADGRTGVEVVKQALKDKHEVVAFVYNPEARNYLPEGIRVIEGNILSQTDVAKAVSECDAAISVVGHIKGSNPRMQTKGIKNIIEAMRTKKIKRIVSLTGTGVRIEGDMPSVFDKIGNWIIKIIDKERIMDGIQHAEVLKNSNLDWTVLRVLKLSDANFTEDENENFDPSLVSTESYTLTENGPAEAFTSRKKVAKIMVDLVSSDEYFQKMPVVSNLS